MTITDPTTPPLLGSPTPLAGFPQQLHSYTNITPFTYRSGLTYQEVLEGLRAWLRDTLVPHIDDEFTEFTDAWSQEVTSLVADVNTALSTWEDTSNTSIAEMVAYVNSSVQSIINSTINVSDPVVNAVLTNLTSASRATLDGRITALAGVKSYLPYNPMDYNAKGDNGTVDTAALQALISAAATFGGATGPVPIELPGHTFIVDLPAGKDYMLQVYPGTVIRGTSRSASVIKVKNGTGDYRAVFAGATTGTDLSNVTLDRFTIDHNTTGNPLTDSSTGGPLFHGYPRYGLYAPVGDNVTVHNMIFKDIDAVNTVVTTGNNNRTMDSLFVMATSSPNWHDYSALYMSGKDVMVRGNTFVGTPGANNARTAIETHASSQSVYDNRIRGFDQGLNITGIRTDGTLSDQIIVHDNIISGCNYGIHLWSGPGGMRNVNVHNNTIVIDHDQWIKTTADYPQAILVDPAISADITNLDIHHNTIQYLPSTSPAQTSELNAAGISLRTVTANKLHNIDVMFNKIIGAFSAGIRVATSIDVGRIKFNEIIDPGSSAEAAMAGLYKTGVIVVGTTYNDLEIADNLIRDTRTSAVITAGVTLSGTSGAVRLVTRRNRTTTASGVVIPPITGSGVLSVYFIEEIDTYTALTLNALIGSEMKDLSTGNRYVQTAAPNGTTWTLRAL